MRSIGFAGTISRRVPRLELIPSGGSPSLRIRHGHKLAVDRPGLGGNIGSRAAVGVVGHGDCGDIHLIDIHRREGNVVVGDLHLVIGEVLFSAICPVAEHHPLRGSQAAAGQDRRLGAILVLLVVLRHFAGAGTCIIDHPISGGGNHQGIEVQVSCNRSIQRVQGQAAVSLLDAPAHKLLAGSHSNLGHLQGAVIQVSLDTLPIGDGPGFLRRISLQGQVDIDCLLLGIPAGIELKVAGRHGSRGKVHLTVGIALWQRIPAGEGVGYTVHHLGSHALHIGAGDLVAEALFKHHCLRSNRVRAALGVEGQGIAVAGVEEIVVGIRLCYVSPISHIFHAGNLLGAKIAAGGICLGILLTPDIGHSVLGVSILSGLVRQRLEPVVYRSLTIIFESSQRNRGSLGGQHLGGDHRPLGHPVRITDIGIPSTKVEVELSRLAAGPQLGYILAVYKLRSIDI